MTTGLVIDASAAIAVIRDEPSAREITALLRATASHGDRRLVPDDFWLEIVNVLVRRYGLAPERAVEAVQQLDELGIESERLDRSLVLVALDIAARTGLSAYDASYLALAEIEDTRLLSLDRQLVAAAGTRAYRLASIEEHRASEPAAPYGGEPIDWARFGPYLARLRAVAQATRD